MTRLISPQGALDDLRRGAVRDTLPRNLIECAQQILEPWAGEDSLDGYPPKASREGPRERNFLIPIGGESDMPSFGGQRQGASATACQTGHSKAGPSTENRDAPVSRGWNFRADPAQICRLETIRNVSQGGEVVNEMCRHEAAGSEFALADMPIAVGGTDAATNHRSCYCEGNGFRNAPVTKPV